MRSGEYVIWAGDFFLFLASKRKLLGLTISVGEFKTKCKVVTKTPFKEDFAMLFQRWLECCINCACTGGGYVKNVI